MKEMQYKARNFVSFTKCYEHFRIKDNEIVATCYAEEYEMYITAFLFWIPEKKGRPAADGRKILKVIVSSST
jgi:hypothetical protein